MNTGLEQKRNMENKHINRQVPTWCSIEIITSTVHDSDANSNLLYQQICDNQNLLQNWTVGTATTEPKNFQHGKKCYGSKNIFCLKLESICMKIIHQSPNCFLTQVPGGEGGLLNDTKLY